MAYAAQSGTWVWRGNNMQSHGRIEIAKEGNDSGTPDIILDASDLETITAEVDSLETTYKQGIAESLNALDKNDAAPDISYVTDDGNLKSFSDLQAAITDSQKIPSDVLGTTVYVKPDGSVTEDSTADSVSEKQIAATSAASLKNLEFTGV